MNNNTTAGVSLATTGLYMSIERLLYVDACAGYSNSTVVCVCMNKVLEMLA